MLFLQKITVITIVVFVPPFIFSCFNPHFSHFQPWTGLGATVLLGVLWSFSAAHLHSPRMMCLVRDAKNATRRDSFCSSFNLQNQSDLAAWDHTDMYGKRFPCFPQDCLVCKWLIFHSHVKSTSYHISLTSSSLGIFTHSLSLGATKDSKPADWTSS